MKVNSAGFAPLPNVSGDSVKVRIANTAHLVDVRHGCGIVDK